MSQLDKINQSINTAKEEKAAASTSGARTKKALGDAVGKVVAYGDTEVPKLGTITLKQHVDQLLKTTDVRESMLAFPLQFMSYVNLKFNMNDVAIALKAKYPVVKDVYAYGAKVVAELDKVDILQEPENKVLADIGKTAIERYINFDNLPAGLTALTVDRKLKYYEDKFGYVLDLRRVVANILLPELIAVDEPTYNEEEKEAVVKNILSKCAISTEFTRETVEAVVEFKRVPEERVYFNTIYKDFVWTSMTMSVEAFKVLATDVIKTLDPKSTVVFKPLATVLKGADKNSAKSKALIKSKVTAYDSVPVIKLSSQFTTNAKGTNKTLYSGCYLVDQIADKKLIKLVFGELINDDVILMADEVSGTMYLVPDLFKILQFAILRKTEGYQYAYVPNITSAVRVNLTVEEGDIRIIFTA